MLLISSQEVIETAFIGREKISPSSIRAIKIDIAQEHFIRPRFGNQMFWAMIEGKYGDFVDLYIKPALAHYVRYGIIDELAVQISDNGAVLYSSTETEQSGNSKREVLDTIEGQKKLVATDEVTARGTQNGTSEDNSTQIETLEGTQIKEANGITYRDNSMAETVLSKSITDSVTSTDSSQKDSTSTIDDKNSKTTSQTDNNLGQLTTLKLREATSAERRIIISRALSDANILLAKAVRYVESHSDLFELYIPSSRSGVFCLASY